jgi:hypothetical protein
VTRLLRKYSLNLLALVADTDVASCYREATFLYIVSVNIRLQNITEMCINYQLILILLTMSASCVYHQA